MPLPTGPAVDFSQLPAKLRDYSLSDESQILTRLLVDGMGFTDRMQLLLGNDEILLAELVLGNILQPGGKDGFNPTANALRWKARIGKVRDCKVDLQLTPTKIAQFYRTWLGNVAKSKPESPYDIPFQEFLMTKIVEKLKENLRLLAAFKGVYKADGTDPQDTMDGLLTLRAAALTSGEIAAANVVAGAPIVKANAVDQFEKVAEKVITHPAYSATKMIALCSPAARYNYFRGYRTENQALPYNDGFNKLYIDGSNIEIVAEPGMQGSNAIFITPETNLFFLADDTQRMDSIIIEYALRNINIMIDFKCAVDFGIGDLIWTNDLA